MIYIGIDVGGMSIKAGIVDEEGNILFKQTCPTGVERGYEAVIRDIADMGLSAVSKSGHAMEEVRSIGIGIPGIMNPLTGIVPLCTNLHWQDVPLMAELRKYTDLPIYVDNDATVAGLAESVKGVSAGCRGSVFVTLGTGVGGGVILNGRVFSGHHGCATEIGHMVTVDGGELCSCGQRGCWERYASASALIRDGRRRCLDNPLCGLMKAVKGDVRNVTARLIIDLAKTGDEDCCELYKNYIHHIVIGLRNLIIAYDPEVIVLGGGVCQAGDFLLNPIREALPKYLFFKTMPHARVELARLTNDAGIIGAAMLGR